MQPAAWLLYLADYLQAELAAFIAQATVWSDRVYWNGYAPLAEAALLIAAAVAAALCMLAYTNHKDVEVWSRLSLAGRWMGAIAVVTLAFWVGGYRTA